MMLIFPKIVWTCPLSSEPTEDHNDPGEFSAMSALPSACYDSGSKDDNQGPWSILVSRAHIYTK